jgi:hypothetical protein
MPREAYATSTFLQECGVCQSIEYALEVVLWVEHHAVGHHLASRHSCVGQRSACGRKLVRAHHFVKLLLPLSLLSSLFDRSKCTSHAVPHLIGALIGLQVSLAYGVKSVALDDRFTLLLHGANLKIIKK